MADPLVCERCGLRMGAGWAAQPDMLRPGVCVECATQDELRPPSDRAVVRALLIFAAAVVVLCFALTGLACVAYQLADRFGWSR